VTLLDVSVADHVATVTLNRPASRNAIASFEDCEEIEATFRRLDADRAVRAAVLTGAGTSFCAGGDLKQMRDGQGLGGGRTSAEVQRNYHRGVRRIATTLAAIDLPLVAGVNGPAIGLGCDLAVLCDVRVAAETALFAASFVKVGIVPGDGGAWILPRVIGMSNALRMILTGEMVDAAAALRMGLVSEVVPAEALLARAHALAGSIAANPPEATRMAKRLVRASAATGLEGALDLAAAYQAILHKTDDHREAVAALLERRAPNFTGN